MAEISKISKQYITCRHHTRIWIKGTMEEDIKEEEMGTKDMEVDTKVEKVS
jgi:hypothetical protein